MKETPLVSLILCVKNGMPFLPDALESVAKQTYRNFELIVQDCLSTDGTIETIQNQKNIPAIRIESVLDRGIGEALNKALKKAKGKIIGTIDADNLLEENALEIVVDFFGKNQNIAAIYGKNRIVDQDKTELFICDPSPMNLLDLLSCKLVPPFATAFFQKDVCGQYLNCDERLKTCADYDLWLKLSHLPIVKLEEILATTRLSDKSMTCRSSIYDQFIADKSFALERYLSYAHGKNLPQRNQVKLKSLLGIYAWAAESVYRIEGPSERYNRYLKEMKKLFLEISSESRLDFSRKIFRLKPLNYPWEINLYGDTNEKSALVQTKRGLIFKPTSPKDHLASPYLSLPFPKDFAGYLKVIATFDQRGEKYKMATLFLQDENYQKMRMVSHQREEIGTKTIVSTYFEFSEVGAKFRILIEGEPESEILMPGMLEIRQSRDRSNPFWKKVMTRVKNFLPHWLSSP